MKHITWDRKIPFLKNKYLLRSVFLAYLVVVLIFSAIISLIFISDGDTENLKAVILPFLGVFLFLFILFYLATWVAIGNKYALRYTVNEEGIKIKGTRDKAKNIRKLAITAGIITANPGVVGAGLLVRDDIIYIKWNDIDDLYWDIDNKMLVIKCNFWKQVALHYPADQESSLKKITDYYLK
jgi:hypothetical protein